MESFVPVDAPPASDWRGPRPDGLAAGLWAAVRPTADTLAGLSLPNGTAIHGSDGRLLGWESGNGSDHDLGQLWLSCARQFPSTGLWPICDADELTLFRGWDGFRVDGQPYWRDPHAVPSDAFDAFNLPDRRRYFHRQDEPDSFRERLEDLGLRDTSMTLAEGSTLPENALARLVAPRAPERLTLVACPRPADSVLLLDFGVANDAATPGSSSECFAPGRRDSGCCP